jgi:arginyl-tRNA synthetase
VSGLQQLQSQQRLPPGLLEIPQPLQLRLLPDAALPAERQHSGQRVFATAIALQLARQVGIPAPELAQGLAQTITHSNVSPISVVANAQGWLYAMVPETSLAIWLSQLHTHLNHSPLTLEEASPTRLPMPALDHQLQFSLHYAHARCCSLLRLSNQAQLVEPTILWLNSEQHLWLQHPSEQALIDLLLQFPARLSLNRQSWGMETVNLNLFPAHDHVLSWAASPQQLLAVCRDWAGGFEQFYRHCQIFSEVKTLQPDLASSRLGLVAILRVVLWFLIEIVLGEKARQEL